MFAPSAEIFSELAFAMPPTYWLIYDARLRRVFVPHVIQPAILLSWLLVVPVYLLSTRKWWGLLYLTIHIVGTSVVSMIGYYGSTQFIWPAVFPESVG